MVLIKGNLQSQGFLCREAEKEMGTEIPVKGNKGPSLSPVAVLRMSLSLGLKRFSSRTSQPTTDASSAIKQGAP